MRLEYLMMKNFRQYNNTKIEFAHSNNLNFTIIEGKTGAGKTNILNAITWCLYGKEKHIDGRYKGLPIVNVYALEKTSKPVEVMVEIMLIEKDGKRKKITRRQTWTKSSDGSPIYTPDTLTLSLQVNDDWKSSSGSDAQYAINHLIPENLEEYFFFDGERMDLYFREKSHREIKEAVFRISQLDLLDKVIDHLRNKRKNYCEESKKFNPNIGNLPHEIEILEMSQESDKNRLNHLSNEKKLKEQELEDINQKLNRSSNENVKLLQEKRATLEISLKETKKKVRQLEEEKLDFLHSKMPYLFCYDALIFTNNLLQAQKEAGKLPPSIQNLFIKNLLDKKICICGSSLDERDEYSIQRRKRVEKLLEENSLSDISQELITMTYVNNENIKTLSDFKEKIMAISREISDLNGIIRQKNEELDKIACELNSVDIDSIKSLEKNRADTLHAIETIVAEISELNVYIKDRIRQIESKRRSLADELKKQSELKEFNDLIQLCDETIKFAEEVKAKIMDNVKNEIERLTSEQFLSLIWKKGTYQGVKIDDDYNISVPDLMGREGLGTLSAGERQVCALSFMAALNNVSGFDVPLIIDTPLGRISNEPTKNIAENLPKFLGGKQVTLLVTDKEFSKEVQETLKDKIGKMYSIIVHEEKQGNLAEVQLIK